MKYRFFVLVFGVSSLCFAQNISNKQDKLSSISSSNVSITSGNSTNSVSYNTLSDTDIVKGLKEALTIGSRNAFSKLALLDGFNKNSQIRIPFPPEIRQVSEKLRKLGLGSELDEFELALNRAAEEALKDAEPIFTNTISQMTISDAKNILTGPSNSATLYLQSKTSDALYAAFSPTINQALGNSLATFKWTEIASLYNELPLVTPVETDLTRYTTGKALAGLFSIIANEEKNIRENPSYRTTELLQKVFGNMGK